MSRCISVLTAASVCVQATVNVTHPLIHIKYFFSSKCLFLNLYWHTLKHPHHISVAKYFTLICTSFIDATVLAVLLRDLGILCFPGLAPLVEKKMFLCSVFCSENAFRYIYYCKELRWSSLATITMTSKSLFEWVCLSGSLSVFPVSVLLS